jgi:CAAX prenyl protease-like protein
MDSALEDRRQLTAYVVPMVGFLLCLAIVAGLKRIGGGFWFESPEYWAYPLQTIGCGALLLWYRKVYELPPIRRPWFTIAVAAVVFAVWISPQAFLGFAPRLVGFNPDYFADQAALYWPTVAMRFVRLAIVVPFVEEIFWRGFLLRYFINERFHTVPFGAFSWFSFAAVTLGFTLVHSSVDWPAAALTGAIYNWIAYRTRSLSSCVLAHAVTNLLLGCWIMHSRQWGFW